MPKPKTKSAPVAALPQWDLPHLHQHLQAAVDLEMWTIPFYMSAMYSIKDPASRAYRLIQSVVYQEMLHAQLAANVANAYGYSPRFDAPVYEGEEIPHVNFKLDERNPTTTFRPFSAEIGPLDEKRVNAMCLIEYPEWDTERTPDLQEDMEEYGSIGELYQAMRVGMSEMRRHVRGRRDQVDEFARFYQNAPPQAITKDGEQGFQQALKLIDIIVEQGEGQTQGVADIPAALQNTADGFDDASTHFTKFIAIRDAARLPDVYSGVAHPPAGSPGAEAQRILVKDFTEFRAILTALFEGKQPARFSVLMAKLGGDILNCWKNNAIPRFSDRGRK
jgi:hypothetical protein